MAIRTLLDHALIARALTSYRQLERRDQLVVTSFGAFLGIVILLFGVWQPLQRYVDSGQSAWERNQELVHWMRSTEKQARQLAGAAQQTRKSGQSLLTLVSRSARTSGIQANKLQPEGNDSVSVWFDSVGFNDLVRWLEKLESAEEVQVHQISINRFGQSGVVNVRLVLKGL